MALLIKAADADSTLLVTTYNSNDNGSAVDVMPTVISNNNNNADKESIHKNGYILVGADVAGDDAVVVEKCRPIDKNNGPSDDFTNNNNAARSRSRNATINRSPVDDVSEKDLSTPNVNYEKTRVNYSRDGFNGSTSATKNVGGGIAEMSTRAKTSALDVVRQMVGGGEASRKFSNKRILSRKRRENNNYLQQRRLDDVADDNCSSSSLESIGKAAMLPATNGLFVDDSDDDDEVEDNKNLHKSLTVAVDCLCDSSLGSSTTCSEDSFELGAVDEFERNNSSRPSETTDEEDAGFRGEKSKLGKNFRGDDASLRSERCIAEQSTKIDLALSSKFSARRIGTEASNDLLSDSSTPVVVDDEDAAGHGRSVVFDKNDKSFGIASCRINGELNSLHKKSRKSLVEDELSKLDTNLPEFDFEKLEQQLADSAKECEMNQRKLMSETVRQKLAMDSAEPPTVYPPAPTTRPLRSNLATRLQTGMNLQICFMNDTVPSEEEEEEDDEDDDECWRGVPKSFSTPNLRTSSLKSKGFGLERSVSNGGDSEKKASELRLAVQQQQAVDESDFDKRRERLESETKQMLAKAKQAAHMQMELEKQAKLKRSVSSIEEIIGVPLGRKKLTRTQLTKMCITQLLIIINDLHSKIELHNEELVHLLIERDNLHMEQDSMLVDIEDLLQHKKTDQLCKLPDFLVAKATAAATSPRSSSSGGACSSSGSEESNRQTSRFRIFKR